MKQRPYSQFDIPRQHIPADGLHYQLPGVHEPQRLYAQELRGASLARSLTERLRGEDVDDGHFTQQLLAAASFNSAWYNYRGIDATMRHIVKLPVLADEKGTEHVSRDELLERSAGCFSEAIVRERRIEQTKTRSAPIEPRVHFELGRALAGASLHLAAVEIVDDIQWMDGYGAQYEAREAAFALAERARESAHVVGAYPSLAQLGTESSELMLYVRRRAPKAAIALIDEQLAVS